MKMLLLFCSSSYMIPFLLFHSSILRLRFVGPVLAGADVVTGFASKIESLTTGSINDRWRGCAQLCCKQ